MQNPMNPIEPDCRIKYSIVVPTCDREDSLLRTITSILHLKTQSLAQLFELLIVDNNPSDRIRNLVEELEPEAGFPVRYIPEPRRGVSHARNTGVKMSQGDYVAFVDDDCTVHPDWLGNIMNTFLEHECDIVQGKIALHVEDTHIPEWIDETDLANLAAYDLGDEIKDADTIMTGNVCIARSVFKEFGLFDTRFGPGASGSAEDVEFFRRLKGTGIKLLYVPGALVYHHLSQERFDRKALIDRYNKMGYSITLLENDHDGAFSRILKLHWKIAARFLKWAIYHLAKDEARNYRQQRKIAYYKGKIRAYRHPMPALENRESNRLSP